ncbi:MAG: hypothetical protein JXA78_02715 [Anaerolineales bacterium]|nr:hypothetical protein [Anaerolineales bacterium]
MDEKAQCPVCGEIISFVTPAKLHRSLVCLTCLTNLQVVALNPLELEILDESGRAAPPLNGPRSRKGAKGKKKHGGNGEYEEYEDLDDYVLEKRLRRKPNRNKLRQNKGWDDPGF